jgi:hypothetical protein
MKKITLLLTFVLISFFASSQEWFEWTESVFITDTISNYSDPFVVPYNETSWVFYQKNSDKSSIAKMDLNNFSDNVSLLFSENANYFNPYFRYSSHPDYLGFLFYLNDEEGESNLYAVKLFENNDLGAPIKVIGNVENKDVMNYSLTGDGFIGYTIDSNCYVANLRFYSDSVYIENEILLDSSSFNAQVYRNQIYWQKIENDTSHILYSPYLYDSDSSFSYWRSPKYADSVGDSRWLTASTSFDIWWSDEICWVKGDTVIGYHGNNNYGEYNTINTFNKPNVRQLSMVNWDIMVKDPFEIPHYLCFTTGLNNDSEIFCSMGEYGYEDSAYLSNNTYLDDNPKVYFGEAANQYDYYVYCIWQTHIDGSIALSMSKSKALIGSSVDENSLVDDYLKVSPNPFTERLSISFNNYAKHSSIKIFDVNGQQIDAFENLNLLNDWQSINWQTATDLSNGVYFVVISIEGKKYVRKIVKNGF